MLLFLGISDGLSNTQQLARGLQRPKSIEWIADPHSARQQRALLTLRVLESDPDWNDTAQQLLMNKKRSEGKKK